MKRSVLFAHSMGITWRKKISMLSDTITTVSPRAQGSIHFVVGVRETKTGGW
jgi:hypothetical protein